MAWLPVWARHACALTSLVRVSPTETEMPPPRARRACAWPSRVMAQPLETAMLPAFSFRASDVLVPEPGQTPKANQRVLELISQSLLNFSQNKYKSERQAQSFTPRPPLGFKLRGNQLLVLPLFLLGIGHESPLQQQDSALSLPLQQACAFLP
jgi:hypothetical protein